RKVIMLTLVLLSLAVCTLAQIPSPCPGPRQFTGNFRTVDRERQFEIDGKIYYDEDNQRIREFEFEQIGSEKSFYDKLKLYTLNIEYRVDLHTRKCNVTAPRRPWFPIGVPPEARFAGEGTLGVVGQPNEQVTIAFFNGNFQGTPYFVSVTQPDCFPVQSGIFFNGSAGFEHTEFFDLVSGITDPMAFIPPRECLGLTP
ncbi:hypothetical protein MP969_26095, partial [Escherichia coli]|nr:hypothetical protein [Escherichia coli]